jgi:hypothetical protein
MIWEVIVAIAAVTVVRLVWILRRPVHKDITFYILPGLSNLRKIIKYAPDFSYVPYGLIWYAINVPIVRLGRYSGRFWMGALALIDGLFLGYSFQFLGLTVFFAYVLLGTFQLLRAPWNASINWLIILAPTSWIFLVLAAIAKFPIGLPIQVWRYTGRAVGHQHNYIYFGLLGTLWVIVFNHLYLLPGTENFIVIGLGIVWCFIFAYAYLERRARRHQSTAEP